VLKGFEQDQKGDQRRLAGDVLPGQVPLIQGWLVQFTEFPLGERGFELPIGSLIDSRHGR
jgi:hypothetical protein